MSLNQLLYNGPDNSTAKNRNWLDIVVNSLRLGSNSSSELSSYYIDPSPVSGNFDGDNMAPAACEFRLEAIGKTATLKIGDLADIVVTVESEDITSSYTIPSAYRPSQDTAILVPYKDNTTSTQAIMCIVKTNGKININSVLGDFNVPAATYSFPEAFCLTWKF